MVDVDIPLLKESRAFVRRLQNGLEAMGECRYHHARRVNWSYRHADGFHKSEAELFRRNPDLYLDVMSEPQPTVEDVYPQALPIRKVLEVVMKVGAHWCFAALGSLSQPFLDVGDPIIYRKCYVDEMENIFDPDEAGVLRVVFPFPLSIKRQLRYLSYLRKKRYPFRFAGYPYGLRDLVSFLIRRNVSSLKRLETRAQLRLGRSIRRRKNFKTIQLSDEFDICSLDFVRAVKRPDLFIVNSAHGVGKYFPVHAYDEFRVLMERQTEYYRSILPCRYVRQALRSSGQDMDWIETGKGQSIQFVFVSQTSSRAGACMDRCEAEVLQELVHNFSGRADIELLIKVHPNRTQPIKAEGFKVLRSLSALRSPEDTIFVSFFSTSHIDPAFKGLRYLLTYDLIKPSISFDDDGSIIELPQLIAAVNDVLAKRKGSVAAVAQGVVP